MGFRIVGLQKIKRGVGEYDPEVEGGIGRVLFRNSYPGSGHGGFKQNRGVESRWSGANDFNIAKFNQCY